MDAPLTLGDLAIDFENPAAIGSIKLVELKSSRSCAFLQYFAMSVLDNNVFNCILMIDN
jgi:hypothetical protein